MINSSETFKTYSKYYNIYIGTKTKDLEFYKSLTEKNRKIVEIGCGTGRILKFFLKNDYHITGIDISHEMLELCKIDLVNFISSGKLLLFNHDFSVSSFNELFDTALITFFTFNYVKNPVSFLKNVYDSLNNKAIIIIDLYYPHVFLNKEIEDKWLIKELKDNQRIITLKEKRRMENNIEHRIQIFSEDNVEETVRSERIYYSPHEIKKYLSNAGFINIRYSLTHNKDNFVDNIEEIDIKVGNYVVTAEKPGCVQVELKE